ncbi:MAG: GspE/PulE family protein [Candidatus Omnitrophota bacterium]
MPNKQKFISELLMAKGVITCEQLQQAEQTQQRSQERIDHIFQQLNINCDENLKDLVIQELGLSYVNPEEYAQSTEIQELINPFFANRYRIFPLSKNGEKILVVFDNPLNFLSLEYFEKTLGFSLEAELIPNHKMDNLLEKYYPIQADIDSPSVDLDNEQEVINDAPVIHLVNMLISDAYKRRASDIHIEPMNHQLRIRFRIDGVLREIESPEKKLQASIISRIKLMSGMNIAEKRLPQDGRIRTVVDNREFDLRISTLPAYYGESVVMRILDKRIMSLEELGFLPKQRSIFDEIINLPNGIILITGPTGSGKSTTLYAVLSSVDRSKKKILTTEDPVEYQINGINQVQIKNQIGLTFARVLRSMLRQAPDIIMVGEIRDLETAKISVQSALTGHLIFSTLHTNDAPSAITRLVDMGIKPYMVSATLQAVLAQRLVRLLCPDCKQPYIAHKDEIRILEVNDQSKSLQLYRAAGCSLCAHTGYLGRTGIFELLVLNDQMRRLIHEQVPSNIIREKARTMGMVTLKEHAQEKVLAGITSFQEMVRITQSDVD